MRKQTLAILFLTSAIVLSIFVGAAAADGTVFRGTYTDDNTFTFENSNLVKGVQLPEGSDITQKVTSTTNGIFSFTIDAPGFAKNGTGKVYFIVSLEDLDVKKVTWRGVQLYQGETPLTTYLYGRDSETAFYIADIPSPGKFTIKFEEGVTKDMPVQGDDASYQAVQKKKKTVSLPDTTTTAKSPVPVLGIITGIGTAVAFAASRRH